MRKKIVAGNWKMNKTPKEAAEFCKLMKEKVVSDAVEVVFCVPFVDLYPVLEELKGTGIGVGAENMHFAESGAYTGEVSAQMLQEMGVGYVILGHSERRQYFGETDEMVNQKVKKALETGIVPILCCGETLEQREAGITIEWVRIQIKCALAGVSAEDAKKVIVAYLGNRHGQNRNLCTGAGGLPCNSYRSGRAVRQGNGRGNPYSVRRQCQQQKCGRVVHNGGY